MERIGHNARGIPQHIYKDLKPSLKFSILVYTQLKHY